VHNAPDARPRRMLPQNLAAGVPCSFANAVRYSAMWRLGIARPPRLAAVAQFNLSEEQQKRLVVQERGEAIQFVG
jgi:hypothetical protein